MTTEPNNPKLKLAIARMLPEFLQIVVYNDEQFVLWNSPELNIKDRNVLETEWLYIVSLVEQSLTSKQREKYLDFIFPPDDNKVPYKELWQFVRATFNQRATALCKVKGVAIE